MILIHLLKTSLIGINANKTRSFLTILGIVIGITGVVLIVSIGKGAEKLILNEISGFGTDIIVIRPGQEPTGPTDIADTIFSDSLKARDIEALRRKSNVPSLADIAPGVIVVGAVSYGGDTFRGQTMGWSAKFMSDVFNLYPESGVLFSDIEIRQKASVAVIGSKVKKELFGNIDPLGKNIKIKGRNFKVIGVFPPRGQVAFLNIDEIILIPPTTAQLYLLGIDYYNEVLVRAKSSELVSRTVRDIEMTLRESHNITDPNKDDFHLMTQKGMVKQIGTILSAFTIFLLSVVAVSLVVGGIGVMNIMLVTVTERTREIGLRKAVGATDKDIMKQFLFEAIYLTGLGGIIGIILGILLSFLVSVVITKFYGFNWEFIFPISAAVLGVGVSIFIGLVFGIYPALRASQKSPIEALRYE